MKSLKAILVVCLLSLGFVGANAQGLNFGVKAGLNVSSYTDGEVDFKPGFNVGVFGQYMFSGAEGFGLEAGLRYSMLGAKSKSYEIAGVKVDAETVNSSYIQLPIQALYKFSVGQNLLLYPSAGVYLGYGIGGSHDYFDAAEEFDFGLAFGLNLQFESIIIGLGYDMGLTELYKDLDPKNQNLSVSVGYLF